MIQMPRLGLSSPQAKAVADYLSGVTGATAGAGEERSAIGKVRNAVFAMVRPIENRLPYPTRENAKKFLVAMFGIGFLIGVLVLASSFLLFAYWRSKRNRKVSN